MAERHREFQIRCKNIFQLSCNCLKVSEKIFNQSPWSKLPWSATLGRNEENVSDIDHFCPIMNTSGGNVLSFLCKALQVSELYFVSWKFVDFLILKRYWRGKAISEDVLSKIP
jgi:hypothetical protein